MNHDHTEYDIDFSSMAITVQILTKNPRYPHWSLDRMSGDIMTLSLMTQDESKVTARGEEELTPYESYTLLVTADN
ncbi:MAG: hypothetical protein OXC40_01735, partial [Proteobacteria bacterium]|nr:hypothetical protein [Pseudomonadota bacterium]